MFYAYPRGGNKSAGKQRNQKHERCNTRARIEAIHGSGLSRKKQEGPP
jgi:hypothetical protein